MIICNKCEVVKEFSEFSKDTSNTRGYQTFCKTCQAEYKRNNRDKRRNSDYVRMYGITLSEYNKMLKEQSLACKICGILASKATHSKLFVDHCHATGAVRGLLCNTCNTALGLLKDSPELCREAANYLEQEPLKHHAGY